MKEIFSRAAVAGTLIIGFLSISGFVAELDWRLAWFSNPRVHFIVALIVAAIWFGFNQKHRWATAATLLALVNLAPILPLFMPSIAAGPIDSTASTVSIALLNTNHGAADLHVLQELEADLLFLQEVTPGLDAALPARLPTYSVLHSHPLSNTHGSAILVHSDAPVYLIESELIYLSEHSKRPIMTAALMVGTKEVQLLSLHTTRPQNQATDAGQQIEVDGAVQWSRTAQSNADTEVIIMGDFNMTPWSTRFWKLLRDGELLNSQRGFGLQNTWPSNIPLIFGIPIDHAVHSRGIQTLKRKVVRTNGTDHAILFVEFGFSSD